MHTSAKQYGRIDSLLVGVGHRPRRETYIPKNNWKKSLSRARPILEKLWPGDGVVEWLFYNMFQVPTFCFENRSHLKPRTQTGFRTADLFFSSRRRRAQARTVLEWSTRCPRLLKSCFREGVFRRTPSWKMRLRREQTTRFFFLQADYTKSWI